jgi:hypothetical protein
MSDLLGPLRDHGDDTIRPLPASEVRHRGDRLRRRRAALQIAATAAAVAVIAGGMALLGAGGGAAGPVPPPSSQLPRPAPSQTPSDGAPSPQPIEVTFPPVDPAVPPSGWRASVPSDFPLDEGYPTEAFDEYDLTKPGANVPAFGYEIAPCGQAFIRVADSSDRLAARFKAPEDYRARELTVYVSADAAQENLVHFVDLFAHCPVDPWKGSEEGATTTEIRRSGLGDEGWTVITRAEMFGAPAPGMTVFEVVRVGNALLLTSESGEGGVGPDRGARSIRESGGQAEPLVEAMCVFAATAC